MSAIFGVLVQGERPPFLEQSVFSLKEFDDDQLLAIDPTNEDQQQECERGRHRTYPQSLPRILVRINGQYGIARRFALRIRRQCAISAKVAPRLGLELRP